METVLSPCNSEREVLDLNLGCLYGRQVGTRGSFTCFLVSSVSIYCVMMAPTGETRATGYRGGAGTGRESRISESVMVKVW